jgi:hypothetical protein
MRSMETSSSIDYSPAERSRGDVKCYFSRRERFVGRCDSRNGAACDASAVGVASARRCIEHEAYIISRQAVAINSSATNHGTSSDKYLMVHHYRR